jgi:hypothetical protein
MTPGTSRDVYGESKQLAEALRVRGEPEAAQRVDDAIDGGSTSSEILFGLRWEFDRLLDRGAGGDAKLAAWIADLRNAVEKALE